MLCLPLQPLCLLALLGRTPRLRHHLPRTTTRHLDKRHHYNGTHNHTWTGHHDKHSLSNDHTPHDTLATPTAQHLRP